MISTNALELGIDVGSLDAALLVGFPNTIASTWQQAGRAGRSQSPALALVIAYDDPIDQYLMRHPEHFFSQTPESAVLDPENPYVLASHLACAAYELPLTSDDESLFGSRASRIAGLLEEEGTMSRRLATGPRPTTRRKGEPTDDLDDTFTIPIRGGERRPRDRRRHQRARASLPRKRSTSTTATRSSFELDLKQKIAYERREVDYYTQSVLDEAQAAETRETRRWNECELGSAPLTSRGRP